MLDSWDCTGYGYTDMNLLLTITLASTLLNPSINLDEVSIVETSQAEINKFQACKDAPGCFIISEQLVMVRSDLSEEFKSEVIVHELAHYVIRRDMPSTAQWPVDVQEKFTRNVVKLWMNNL